MQLYDTRSGRKSELDIPRDRPLTMYVCGVTPYDTTHVGHAHTFLIFDVLARYLRFRGADVRYCQNVTDVDDPLFERAERDGVPWEEIAHSQTQRYVDDCAALNLIPPTYFPKASEEIAGMLEIVERLVALGCAYVRDGNVYFSTKTDPHYGEMARLGYRDLLALANQRGNRPDDPLKQDPLDFVLWQTCKPGIPSWPSPWGAGRPGWHIECSAMAMRYLGPRLDIHGGGRDLIFPHHPSEIAQSEAFTGERPFARFWVHCGLVWLDGEKMSKSLGNMVFVRDVLQHQSADALRWYLLTFPYREDFHYERGGPAAVESHVARLGAALQAAGGPEPQLDATATWAAALALLDDDLQTGPMLALLDDLAREVLEAASAGRNVQAAQGVLRELAGILGFKAATISP